MYQGFAEVYDRLTRDIAYDRWADYLESAFLKFGSKPHLVLELGCGTGNLTLEMARRGYEMIGLDSSADMLGVASSKAKREDLDILFVHQDMREFELFGTVDAIICMLDSINYVTRKRDLEQVFRLVHNYLNPGGLFIFDVNSPYKLSSVLGNETFFEMDDEITWVWNNTYDAKKRQCIFDLTFFIRQEGDLYRKVVETHVERAYATEELAQALKKSDFRFIGEFGDLSFEKPDLKENRIFYVSSK